MKGNVFDIINNFNDTHDIKDVIEKCTGTMIKNKSLSCPIHGGDNKHGASIDIAKNIFSCWTHDCGKGLSPWTFIKKYYNLNSFREVAIKCNELFSADIPILKKNFKTGMPFIKPIVEYNTILKNDGIYITKKVQAQIEDILKEYKHIVLNANTGMGKTYMTTEMCKKLSKELNLDYVFLVVPTRSIVENVNAAYDYTKFYGDDTSLDGKFIVMTYHKATLTNTILDGELALRAVMQEVKMEFKDLKYMVIADEVHELLSKRNILGITLAKEIENLIINADYSICMSANTNDFITAYKDSKLYKHTIKIEPKKINYTLDNLNIYRCSGKQEIRIKQITDKIIEQIGTKEHIFISIDNKKQLEQISKVLDEYAIDNVIINADNKEEADIAKEYLSIINNSKLKTTVVLCTSIINAGVNIMNKNVLSIMYQSKLTFDTNKIDQFLGRLRTSGNNDAIVFLNKIPNEKLENPSLKSNKIISSIEKQFEYNMIMTKALCLELNETYFNYYMDDDMNFKHYLELILDNDKYRYYAAYFYIDNNIVKVDHIGIYEKSRLEWLRLNYYNDAFIKEMLKDVKAKNKNDVIIIISNKKIDTDLKINKEDVKPLEQYLNEIKEDDKYILELYSYINKTIKSKDFKEELLINLYTDYKNNKKYKEFIKTLKDIFTALENKKFDLTCYKLDILNEIIDIFVTVDAKCKPIGKSKRDAEITRLKRVIIYNNMYPLGTDIEEIKTLGDIQYYHIRQLDKLCNSRHKPSDRQLKTIINSILKDKRCIYVLNNEIFEDAKNKHTKAIEQQRTVDILQNTVGGKWYNDKGKEIDFQLQLEALITTIKQIYNCSDNLHLYSLK